MPRVDIDEAGEIAVHSKDPRVVEEVKRAIKQIEAGDFEEVDPREAD